MALAGFSLLGTAGAELKGTNATFHSWDDVQLRYQNSNATIVIDGKWHPFYAHLNFDNVAVDPAAASQSNGVVSCSAQDRDGNGLTGTSTPWAGTLQLSVDHSDTGVFPTVNGFRETRCWELITCDRQDPGTGSEEGADLSVLPRYQRYTIDITNSGGAGNVCPTPNGNTTASSPGPWNDVTLSNGFLTLLSQDVVNVCNQPGRCDRKIDTNLYVILDRDCDGVIDDADGINGGNTDPSRGDLSLIDSGNASPLLGGRIPRKVGNNDPDICFFAQGLKPDFTSTPVWTGNIQARITAPVGSSGEKTVNHTVAGSVGDMGDLPDDDFGFPTFNYELSGHVVNADDPFIGTSAPVVNDQPDFETVYNASADATGDDADGGDDEDGVLLPTTAIFVGPGVSVYTATVTANNTSGEGAQLCAWFDIDQSNDFDNSPNTSTTSADPEFADRSDTGERSCVTVPNGTVEGTFLITWTIPLAEQQNTGTFFFRFRITTDSDFLDANLLSPAGIVDSGEIEDHAQDITSLPVTLNRFKANVVGNGIDFKWGTATETSTVGFNFWAQVEGQWLPLNEQLFLNQATDSLTPQSYRHTVSAPPSGVVQLVQISSVDTDGSEHFFGPFELGHQYGSGSSPEPIPWESITEDLDRQLTGKGYEKSGNRWRKPGRSRAKGNQNNPAASAAPGDSVIYLETTETGVHRVTFAQLLAVGVNLNGMAPGDIAVTHKGLPVPRRVETGGGPSFGSKGFIDFYADAVDEADKRYTRTNVYRLVLDGTLSQDSGYVSNSSGSAPSYYIETVDRDVNLVYGISMPTAEPWYEHRLVGIPGAVTGRASVDLDIDNLVTGVADSRTGIRLGLTGISSFAGVGDDHQVQVYLNGGQAPVASLTNDGVVDWRIKVPVAGSDLVNGANNVRVEVPGVPGYIFDLLYADTYAIDYPRAYIAVDDALSFTEQAGAFEIDGYSSNKITAYAWTGEDLYELKVQRNKNGGSYRARVPGVPVPAAYWVSTEDALPTPGIVNIGAPKDLTALGTDYIVVAHAGFVDALTASDFVSAKEAQGYSVHIVEVGELFDHYGDGFPVPDAIRSYLKAQDTLADIKQVLLVGGATSDPLDYLGAGSIDFVPTHFAQAGPVIYHAPADGVTVDLYDEDGVADRSVGRWPVRTVAELETIIAKTLQYQQVMASQRNALLVADSTDPRFTPFSEQTERVAANLLDSAGHPWSSLTSVFVDNFGSVGAARTALRQSFNDGNAVTIFSGHASPASWTFQGLLDWQTAQDLENAGKPTLIGTISCYTSYFVSPTTNTIGHQLLLSGDRGAALIHGAATLSGFTRNEGMLSGATSLMSDGASAGEAVLSTRRRLGPNFQDVVTNWSLLGDPSLRFNP